MGHQRSQEKGWVRFRGSPGISFPEDLQDQNERFLHLEEFLALLGSLCFFYLEYSLSFSKSHPFLKSLFWPVQVLVLMRSVTITNGVSLTDKWETGCLRWPWTPPNFRVSLLFLLKGGAEVLRFALHYQTGETRLQLCGWWMRPRSQKELFYCSWTAWVGWIAQGWFRWSAKGSRKQNPWEGNWAAHSRRGLKQPGHPSSASSCSGIGSCEGLMGGKGSSWALCYGSVLFQAKHHWGLRIQTGQETSKDFKCNTWVLLQLLWSGKLSNHYVNWLILKGVTWNEANLTSSYAYQINSNMNPNVPY